MTDSRCSPRRSWSVVWLCAGWAVGCVVAGAGLARAATDATVAARDAGTWDLAFEKGNRRCRVNLERTANPMGFDLGMPAGCRRAFPSLAAVRAWSPAEGDHVVFDADGGQPLADFGPNGGPSLTATMGEEDTYTLTPTDQARQEAISHLAEATTPATAPVDPGAVAEGTGVLVDSTSKPARGKVAAPLPTLRPADPAAVAGHYAVVRQGKDTGCMVTLDEGPKGARSGLKAKLAPACRDQGIVIFDPVGWQITKGQLVLTAKKGHTTVLSQRDERTWANAPAKGAALVLKRL